jgi:hypothetical protein
MEKYVTSHCSKQFLSCSYYSFRQNVKIGLAWCQHFLNYYDEEFLYLCSSQCLFNSLSRSLTSSCFSNFKLFEHVFLAYLFDKWMNFQLYSLIFKFMHFSHCSIYFFYFNGIDLLRTPIHYDLILYDKILFFSQ